MIDYYEYIKSEEWFIRTESVRERNYGICECCMMRYGTSVHHRTYANLGNEPPKDLLHVCTQCHKMIHRKGVDLIWKSRVPFLNLLRDEISKELEHYDE